MRAFRPSHFSTPEDLDEEAERVKRQNLSLYERLVSLGKPLFDLAGGAEQRKVQEKAAPRRR